MVLPRWSEDEAGLDPALKGRVEPGRGRGTVGRPHTPSGSGSICASMVGFEDVPQSAGAVLAAGHSRADSFRIQVAGLSLPVSGGGAAAYEAGLVTLALFFQTLCGVLKERMHPSHSPCGLSSGHLNSSRDQVLKTSLGVEEDYGADHLHSSRPLEESYAGAVLRLKR